MDCFQTIWFINEMVLLYHQYLPETHTNKKENVFPDSTIPMTRFSLKIPGFLNDPVRLYASCGLLLRCEISTLTDYTTVGLHPGKMV